MSSARQPIVVMTLMIRDEIDIIEAWLQYHLAQEIDQFIITDNDSNDGTLEILQRYAADHTNVDLRSYEPHDKRQHAVVTEMARSAANDYGADWVLNSDADEFWVATGEPIGAAVRRLPGSGESFPVPVFNMMSAPLESGFDLRQSVYQDRRSEAQLAAVGLHAHPTQNLIHRGSPDVEVAQGNHFTDLPQAEHLPEDVDIRVFHYPMRSWEQYSWRVQATGLAYSENPDLRPSPRHHTLRDYRWLRHDVLKPFFVARHPRHDESREGFVVDRTIADAAEVLNLAVTTPVVPMDAVELKDALSEFNAISELVLGLEKERVDDIVKELANSESVSKAMSSLQNERNELVEHYTAAMQKVNDYEERVAQLAELVEMQKTDLEANQQRISQLRNMARRQQHEITLIRNQLTKYENFPPIVAARSVRKLLLRR